MRFESWCVLSCVLSTENTWTLLQRVREVLIEKSECHLPGIITHY